ncbi:hypothetical protein [Arthrobacter methylotrophus]|uniref:hypothetical protein n=1 Tax=Arthrobacter methylotrophus TaxID=121291 RepID=UPI0031EDB4B7
MSRLAIVGLGVLPDVAQKAIHCAAHSPPAEVATRYSRPRKVLGLSNLCLTNSPAPIST